MPSAFALSSFTPSPARIIRHRKSLLRANVAATPPHVWPLDPSASMTPFLVSEYAISDCQYAVASVLICTGGGRVATAAASKNSLSAMATRKMGHGGSMPAELPGGIVGGVTPEGLVPTRTPTPMAMSPTRIVQRRVISENVGGCEGARRRGFSSAMCGAADIYLSRRFNDRVNESTSKPKGNPIILHSQVEKGGGPRTARGGCVTL